MFGKYERPDHLPDDHWVILTVRRSYRVTEETADAVREWVQAQKENDVNKMFKINDYCGGTVYLTAGTIYEIFDSSKEIREREDQEVNYLNNEFKEIE